MFYRFWIDVRNWLLLKLAGSSTVIINAEITGMVNLSGEAALIMKNNFRNCTLRTKEWPFYSTDQRMAVIAELMGEEAAKDTADRIDAMYVRMKDLSG